MVNHRVALSLEHLIFCDFTGSFVISFFLFLFSLCCNSSGLDQDSFATQWGILLPCHDIKNLSLFQLTLIYKLLPVSCFPITDVRYTNLWIAFMIHKEFLFSYLQPVFEHLLSERNWVYCWDKRLSHRFWAERRWRQ